MQKRKTAFNIIDVIIIVLVVALGLAAYFLFFRQEEAPVDNQVKETSRVRYVLQINELPAEYADNIEVGECIIDYGTHTSAGDVVAVDFENYVYVGHDKTTGEQKLTTVDDYVNLYITVEGDAVVKNDEMYYVNDTSMYIGKRLDMMMPDLFCSGYCISLETVE